MNIYFSFTMWNPVPYYAFFSCSDALGGGDGLTAAALRLFFLLLHFCSSPLATDPSGRRELSNAGDQSERGRRKLRHRDSPNGQENISSIGCWTFRK